MAEKNINNHIFNDDEDSILDLDIRTEIHFSGKDHPEGKMVPVLVDGKEEYILIPLDIKDGATIKVCGRGKHNPRSGKTGDLYVLVHIGEKVNPKNRLLICAVIVALFVVSLMIACGIGALFAHLSLPEKEPNTVTNTSSISPTSGHTHTWIDATYDTPKTCSACGATVGTPIEKPSVKVSDIVSFGSYEQDGLQSNGTEPIKWLVLDVQEDKALLLSYDALDSRPYNDVYQATTWENCTLRKWLNTEFLHEAFSNEEQNNIIVTELDNGKSEGNKKWKTDGGNNTEDAIFLLSYADTDRYFDDSSNRKCAPTNYAIKMGADVRILDDGVTSSGWWWLRSPGEKSNQAAFVNFDGTRYTNGVGNGYLSVRPALWVKLSGLQFS